MKPGEAVRWEMRFQNVPESAREPVSILYQPIHFLDRRLLRKDYWYDDTHFTESIRAKAEKSRAP
jgi:hypothetical protein